MQAEQAGAFSWYLRLEAGREGGQPWVLNLRPVGTDGPFYQVDGVRAELHLGVGGLFVVNRVPHYLGHSVDFGDERASSTEEDTEALTLLVRIQNGAAVWENRLTGLQKG